jgi:hypothetical protein
VALGENAGLEPVVHVNHAQNPLLERQVTHKLERRPKMRTLWRMLKRSSLCASLVRMGCPSHAARSTTLRET